MSRRDVIIVAVLVNAGLLIVLFASALKSNDPHLESLAAPVKTVSEHPDFSFSKETLAPSDEVDLALKEFSKSNIPPITTAPTQPVSSFAEDLKSIATPKVPEIPTALEHPAAVQTLVAPIARPPTTTPGFTEVTVKKGDVLEKIARYNHSTVSEIMKANQLTSTNLRIGQVLKIPHKSLTPTETFTISHSTTPTQEATPRFYTVKKGDSPWTIAVKNHLKVEDLLKLNNMNEDQARRLKVGDQIRIE